MSRPPKVHDNGKVFEFLSPYYLPGHLCADHPAIGDIFAGLLSAKTSGDSSTRGLSRQTLFHILTLCPVITTEAVHTVTHGFLAERTARAYASLARTASHFIGRFIDGMPLDAAPKLR